MVKDKKENDIVPNEPSLKLRETMLFIVMIIANMIWGAIVITLMLLELGNTSELLGLTFHPIIDATIMILAIILFVVLGTIAMSNKRKD